MQCNFEKNALLESLSNNVRIRKPNLYDPPFIDYLLNKIMFMSVTMH